MMQFKNNYLKLRLVLFIIKGNIISLIVGKINLRESLFGVRKQIIIASNFKGAKYTKVGNKIFIDPFAPYFPSSHFLQALNNNSCDKFPLKPNYAQISITNRCPCECFHCHVKNTHGDDIPKETIMQCIEDIAKHDFPLIFFVGGEPISRFVDLVDFITTAQYNNIDTRIFTSGVGLTHGKLKQLKDAGLNGICVSLDHHVEAKHNQLRAHPKAFEWACAAIRMASEYGFYVSVVCCVTSPYVASKEFSKIVDLAEQLGAHSIQLNEIRPVGRALDANDTSLYLTRNDKELLIQYYHKNNKTGRKIAIVMPWYNEEPDRFGCTATSGQTAYIDSSGNVQPCQLVKMHIGNITKNRFRDIWNDFLPHFAHPVRDCLVYPVNELLLENNQEYLEGEIMLRNWNDLCQQETTEMFKLFNVKPTSKGQEKALENKYDLNMKAGRDFQLLTEHWLPIWLGVPYIALGRKLYCKNDCTKIPRHEYLHIAQFRRYGYFLVISHYLWYLVINSMRYRNVADAFRNIPFEQEAQCFEKEGNGDLFL